MKKILSGIQPTGNMHLGNYLGAIKNWVALQEENECLFCLVDLHALTTRPNPEELKKSIFSGAAIYLAAGIDPKKSSIFVQSEVPAHSELMWILSCYTPLGWLNRMTQFKEKSGKNKDQSVLGLYSYPVLMAADILLYQTTHVPVGEDQKQHIEMTRDLAITFNQQHGQDIFTTPEPLIGTTGCRIMSLRDGTSKMSKSDPSENSRISLFDDPDTLTKKIKKAKTDADPFPSSKEECDGRPEVQNLIQIYSALNGSTPESLYTLHGGQGFAPFKEALADLCVEKLTAIRENYLRYEQNPDAVYHVLKEGQEKAGEQAEKTLKSVKHALGMPS